MRLAVLVVLAATTSASADLPDTQKQLDKQTAALRRDCERGVVDRCMELGGLADSDYTSLTTGFHHPLDTATATWAYQRALALLDPKCDDNDGKACNAIARIYFSQSLSDDAKRVAYLEKACAAHDAWSCFDRGQSSGRSKSATVKWYAEACRLGYASGCGDLPMIVLASLVLDPIASAPMDAGALRKMLEDSRKDGERSQLAQERALALAVARLWSGDPKAALDEVAAADAKVTSEQARLHIFAAYIQLAAADGVDKARVAAAWQRIVELTPLRKGKYEEQELESDYAWADPTEPMKRARAIATRNGVR